MIPPKVIAGWPKVSQGGVTMTGQDLLVGLSSLPGEEEVGMGGPVIKVTITGLAPGEVVSLSVTGRYDRALACGPLPSGCGHDTSFGCWPVYGKEAKGRVRVSAQPTADASGTAHATLRFAIPEMEDACPVEGGFGWLPSTGMWKVQVTDEAHGLRLTPDKYAWGP